MIYYCIDLIPENAVVILNKCCFILLEIVLSNKDLLNKFKYNYNLISLIIINTSHILATHKFLVFPAIVKLFEIYAEYNETEIWKNSKKILKFIFNEDTYNIIITNFN